MLVGLGLLGVVLTVGCSPGPQVAAKEAFEQWAQQAGIPYRDVRYETLRDDGTYAAVRIVAQFRQAADAPWLENEAEVECRKVGEQWQCESWMYWQLTKAEQERVAAATATASAASFATATAEAAATATLEAQLAALKGLSKIAFVSDRDGNDEIYVMDADGTGRVNLTNNPGDDYNLVWSPDGTRIAFVSFRDGNGEIYVMDADGTGRVNLSNHPDNDWTPAWSPDGRYIAFKCSRPNEQICLMNADGTNVVELTDELVSATHPSWSPDGRHIAFASYRDDNYEIYVMDADGSNQIRLTNSAGDDLDPAWSPVT